MSILPAFRQRSAALQPYFDDESVTEICINEPGRVWLGRQESRHMECVSVEDLTYDRLKDIADLIAHNSDQRTSAQAPLLSASIPTDLTGRFEDGDYRIQVILPPVVEQGTIGIAIRKPSRLDLNLTHYEKSGAFACVNQRAPEAADAAIQLGQYHRDGNWPVFFPLAIRARKTIFVSAGTNTGKTAFVNMLLKLVPREERILTIEDSRELKVLQPNRIHLLYSRGNQGVAKVGAVELLETALRMTPDRIIPGELRGAEAYAALEMLNSGHSGLLTTMHAESPAHMFERLAQMVMRFGSTMKRAEIIDYARSLIDIVVQMRRLDDGRRIVSEVLYVPR